jgi:inhibitor of cysteine peptidase
MQYNLKLVGVFFVLFLVLASGTVYAMTMPNTYTQNDSGKNVNVSYGGLFRILLPANPSTGYSWNMTLGDGLYVVRDRSRSLPGPALPGKGGNHEWVIQAVKPGHQKVSGIYKQQWMPTYGNETTFMLDVYVTGNETGAT